MKLFKPTKTTPEQKAYYNSTEYHTTTQLEHNILDIFSDQLQETLSQENN